MTVYVPLELGNPALRQPAAPVGDPTAPAVAAVVADLRETLAAWRQAHGWGRALSAPTIGISQRIVVIEFGDQQYVLINPQFEQWSTVHDEAFESCTTLPSLWGCVSRPASVVVTAVDTTGQTFRLAADGELARIIQHEIDHLDGLVWLDREPDLSSLCSTDEYRRRYKPAKPSPDPAG